MRTYYVGMDVHQASIVIVVLNGAGKVVMEMIIETGADTVRGFIKQLRGKVYVTFEEGTQANWLYDVIRPLVTEVVVCDPRHNKLLQSGNKSDRVDARKLAEFVTQRVVAGGLSWREGSAGAQGVGAQLRLRGGRHDAGDAAAESDLSRAGYSLRWRGCLSQ